MLTLIYLAFAALALTVVICIVAIATSEGNRVLFSLLGLLWVGISIAVGGSVLVLGMAHSSTDTADAAATSILVGYLFASGGFLYLIKRIAK